MRLIKHRRRALPVRPPCRPAPRERAHVPVARRLRGQPGQGARGGGDARGAGRGAVCKRAYRARGHSERAGCGALRAVRPRGAGQAHRGGGRAAGARVRARGAGGARGGRCGAHKGAVGPRAAAGAGDVGGSARGRRPGARGAGDGVHGGEGAVGARGAEHRGTGGAVERRGAGHAGELTDAIGGEAAAPSTVCASDDGLMEITWLEVYAAT